MMDYNEMTDAELDQLSIEEILKNAYDERGGEVIAQLPNKDGVLRPKRWNPTHPDSNQAERYLFPKLSEKGLYVVMDYLMAFVGVRKLVFKELTIFQHWQTNTGMNRAKVIACLEAWDKKNEL